MSPGELVALVVEPQARRLLPVANAPRLSNASNALLRPIQIVDEYGDQHSIQVPVERALAVRVDEREVVTLWTLGGCPEWLVLGYLLNQRLVDDVTLLESISVDWESATATVVTRGRTTGESEQTAGRQPVGRQHGLGAQPGGLIASVEALALTQITPPRISRTTLLKILEGMRQHDAVYRSAGSVHSCALFHGGELWVSVEDTSRRNGLDAITGWMALHGVSGAGKVLFTSGRLTAEMVMKAALNGLSIVVSRKGVTAVCCDLAEKLGMTLLGHAANRRYSCYAGAEHFDAGL